MQLKGKNVLVTGGAGFIGSHLVDRIIKCSPRNLIVVDNFFLGRELNLENARTLFPDIKVLRLDASNFASMLQVVKDEGIEVVFDLAVIPLPTSLKYPVWTIDTNIKIATNLCELARLGQIKTYIHCSSSEAYGTAQYIPMDEKHPESAITPYAASKAAADQVVLSYCKTFNIDAAIVRPFNNYGPRQNPGTYAGIIPIVVNRIKRNEPIEIFGDGEQTRDFIYVSDTADAFIKVYEQTAARGMVINIATGKEVSINTLVNTLIRVMDHPGHSVVHSGPRPGDVRRHCGSIELAKKLFNFSPMTDFDKGLAATVEWYLKNV